MLLSDKFLWATTGESWTVRAVILLSVAVSATTTFLTMRQSAKRGMMNQQMPDPDQPGAAMAQSMSKNMMYIAPFFALTGLYWQYGLVIYWVTTNVWTLGQQHILFRNLPIVGSATVGVRDVGGIAAQRRGRRSAPVKSSLAAAKGNGSAKTATKPGTTTKPSTTTKPEHDQATNAGTAAKHDRRTASSANGTAGKAKVPAAKRRRLTARRPNRLPTPLRTAVWSAPRSQGTAAAGCSGSARASRSRSRRPGGARDQGRPAAAGAAGAQQALRWLW